MALPVDDGGVLVVGVCQAMVSLEQRQEFALSVLIGLARLSFVVRLRLVRFVGHQGLFIQLQRGFVHLQRLGKQQASSLEILNRLPEFAEPPLLGAEVGEGPAEVEVKAFHRSGLSCLRKSDGVIQFSN